MKFFNFILFCSKRIDLSPEMVCSLGLIMNWYMLISQIVLHHQLYICSVLHNV